MRFKAGNILAVCSVLFFLIGCSCSKTKVIPKGKMARIYAEMLVMDQWVAEHPRFRNQADTSLVYEPILNEYGYTTEDYRASVAHYMNDPERYSRILRRTTEILDEKLTELKELKRIEDRRKAVVPYVLEKRWIYYNNSVERLWETGDSISAVLDSLKPVYVLTFHQLSDTTYDGLNMVVREKPDTVAVKDTIPVKETPKEEVKTPKEETQISNRDESKKPIVPTRSNDVNIKDQKLFSTVADSLKRK